MTFGESPAKRTHPGHVKKKKKMPVFACAFLLLKNEDLILTKMAVEEEGT